MYFIEALNRTGSLEVVICGNQRMKKGRTSNGSTRCLMTQRILMKLNLSSLFINCFYNIIL